MKLLSDYVWCSHYGSIHDNEDDPEQEGPMEPFQGETRTHKDGSYAFQGVYGPEWTLADNDDGYNIVWHFKCPGPHYKVWQGSEL